MRKIPYISSTAHFASLHVITNYFKKHIEALSCKTNGLLSVRQLINSNLKLAVILPIRFL